MRRVWPGRSPLFVRVSATDWVDGAWDIEQSVALAEQLIPLGVDLIDCSSGGVVPGVQIPARPGYQVPSPIKSGSGREYDRRGGHDYVGDPGG